MQPSLHKFPDPDATAAAAARFVLESLEAAVQARGRATLAVSGGSTPRRMFERMVALTSQLDWTVVDLFWADERMVPPDDPESNYRMTHEALIRPLGLDERQVHRIRGELVPMRAAQLYEEEIRQFFRLASGEPPRFDVLHLGMGDDAHTASLFPGEARITGGEGIAANVFAEMKGSQRVTLLPGVLRNAERAFFLVTGGDKARALREVLRGPYDPSHYPAQVVARDGDTLRLVDWFVDEAAAAAL